MEGCPSHEDLQYDPGYTSFGCYVLKYLPKMSDSWSDELLADDAELSGDATAAAVLAKYKPLEPEMVLQLFAQQMPQYRLPTETGGAK
eukprot:4443175-Karenia_brevis.AAC.1